MWFGERHAMRLAERNGVGGGGGGGIVAAPVLKANIRRDKPSVEGVGGGMFQLGGMRCCGL